MAAKEVIPGCTVCQKPYGYDTEGPFLLPCLHSVCVHCLKSDNDKTLLCSCCEETFPRASYPIDAVTRKKTLLSTIVHNSNELLCSNRDDGNQAMSWCQECEAFLCEHCHVAHEDMKATRKHRVILVLNLTNCPQTLKGMSYCDRHARHPVILYDSSCNFPLCTVCARSEHTSCKTEDLEAAYETRLTFLEDQAVQLRAKLDRLKNCQTLLKDIGQRLKPQQKAVEELIRCTFQNLHLMLDQREIELKTEINESTTFLTQRSDHQLVILDKEIDKLTMNLDFIQKSTLFPNPVEHFAMKDVIDKRIMAAAESEIPRVNGQEYSITFSRDGLSGLQQHISSIGGLLTNRVESVPSLKMDKRATTLASQMAQKPIFTSGYLGAGVKTASTPLTKVTNPEEVPAPPQPFSQIPQAQAQNLVNRAVTSTISPSASTAEALCIFQGKATYTSKIGAKQEGNVKVFFFGAEKGGRVRMETLSTKQIILNHDINTLKLLASFIPQLVTWKKPQHDGKGEETVYLNFDHAELAQKLKSVIQKIQEAGKKSKASPPKPAVATSSPFTISGSQAFKPTTTQTPTGSSSAVFGQAQTAMPASAALAALSAKQGDEKTVQSGETPKPSFGRFTFSTTPVIKSPEDQSKASPPVKLRESSLKVTSPAESGPVAANQPKPFAGFTFTPKKTVTQQAPFTFRPSSASTASSVFTLGQNIGNPVHRLSNLAANTSTTRFSGLKTAQDPSKGEDEERVEEYEPNLAFKPVINLSDLVEMKTGEEDEEKLFGERARLFRFDANTNQWKEKGIGEVKILYNKASERYRILMRREQVLKICANHNMTKGMKLTPVTSSDRAWCWSAMDFAENEMKMEKLAIKFKSPELACQFKECFEKYQNMLEDSPVKPIPESIGSSEVAQKKKDPKGMKSFVDMFKPKTGSWECQGCYFVNKGDQLKCPACSTNKPGADEEVKKAEAAKPATGISSGGFKIGEGGFQIGGGFSLGKKQESGGFGFGSAFALSGGGFPFASKPAQKAESSTKDSTKETPVDPDRKAAKNILKSNTSTIGPGGFSLGGGGFKLDGVGTDGFSFSPKQSTPAKPAKSEPADSTTGGLLAEMMQSNDPQPKTTAASSAATSGFSFTPKSSGFNFASAADSAKKDGGFQFNLGKVSTLVKNQEKKESSSPFQFTFSLTPSKTPQSKASVISPKSPEGDVSNIYFEPIVSLPDKVDVKTGEEEEVTRFEQRAKLYRFSEGEWKERGLGTMKILEHKTSHRYRFLMRREQIFKVCCNHVITPELELKPMASGDGKSWVWYAKDFSEEEGKVEQLAIKFKNKEIADQFKKVFDAGKAGDEKGTSAAAEREVSAKHIEGEEGWEVVYCQRSKLFRFVRDSNQWKERAVGDMKILKQDDKYRMLMRRDQVHKVACNHLISPKIILSPMATSQTAWCWTAQDCVENEAKVEQFALRFKTEELAKQFKKKFEEVQELIRQTEAAAPAENTNNSATESIREDVPVTEEEDDDDDDDDDSEEESIMFEKRATLTYFEDEEWKELGMGNLKILYIEDLNGNQLYMVTDDKQMICNHVICREHAIRLDTPKKACMWSAQDFSTDEPVKRNFKASFSSVAASVEFAKKFMESVSLARDSELSEKISHEMDTPVIFSHGDATGDQKR